MNIHRMLRPGGFAVLWIKTESDISEILQTLVNDERFENHITMVNIIIVMLCPNRLKKIVQYYFILI